MLKDITKGIKGNKTLYALVSVIVVIIIVAVVWHLYKAIKTGSAAVGQALGNAEISVQTGIPAARVTYIRSEANKLWDEGVQTHWYTLGIRNYNEDMFIETINAMANVKEVALLDELYKERSAERLKDAITASFDDTERAKLNAQYYAALQS